MVYIPTKVLYRLQACVMQEFQSRALTDATNLEVGREVAKVLHNTFLPVDIGEGGGEEMCRQVREGTNKSL